MIPPKMSDFAPIENLFGILKDRLSHHDWNISNKIRVVQKEFLKSLSLN